MEVVVGGPAKGMVFRGLVNDAKAALSSLALQYLARASVAVPFLISLGFALAAITLMLIERFGPVTAYWVMAGALALVDEVETPVAAAEMVTDAGTQTMPSHLRP
jgi:hypothetical protein